MVKNQHSPSIILIEHLNEIGGSSRVSIALVAGLAEKFNFHVIIPYGDYLHEFKEAGANIYEMPLNSFRPSLNPKNWSKQLRLVSQIRQSVKSIKKNCSSLVVHINGLPNILPAIAIFGLKLSIVWHVHETSINPRLIFRLFALFACSTSNLVVAVSEATANALRETIYGQPNNIKVIYNCPFLSTKQVGSSQFKLPTKPEGVKIVAMAARIAPYKGIREFIQIAKKTIEQTANVEFWFAGPKLPKYADYFEAVIADISDRSIANKIKYLGELASCQDFFKNSDIVVSTALYVEPFGLTLVEAMSLSKPVIAPPYGGPQEIVADGNSGFLVDPREPILFSQKIIELLSEPYQAKNFGEAGYQRVQTIFSKENFLDSFNSVYLNLG